MRAFSIEMAIFLSRWLTRFEAYNYRLGRYFSLYFVFNAYFYGFFAWFKKTVRIVIMWRPYFICGRIWFIIHKHENSGKNSSLCRWIAWCVEIFEVLKRNKTFVFFAWPRDIMKPEGVIIATEFFNRFRKFDSREYIC